MGVDTAGSRHAKDPKKGSFLFVGRALSGRSWVFCGADIQWGSRVRVGRCGGVIVSLFCCNVVFIVSATITINVMFVRWVHCLLCVTGDVNKGSSVVLQPMGRGLGSTAKPGLPSRPSLLLAMILHYTILYDGKLCCKMHYTTINPQAPETRALKPLLQEQHHI